MFRRLAARFAGVLGLMGLFLVTVGLYGVLTQSVTQRSWEMAVRLSLGAPPGAVRRPVILGGMGLVLLGLVLGLPLSVATTNVIRTFLYGMDGLDPVTLGSITAVFLLVGGMASYFPAARAVATNPASLLREE
jgi:ABC-type lipoprotein release transport system permease subunit